MSVVTSDDAVVVNGRGIRFYLMIRLPLSSMVAMAGTRRLRLAISLCVTMAGVVMANPDAKRLYSNLLANYDRHVTLLRLNCDHHCLCLD